MVEPVYNKCSGTSQKNYLHNQTTKWKIFRQLRIGMIARFGKVHRRGKFRTLNLSPPYVRLDDCIKNKWGVCITEKVSCYIRTTRSYGSGCKTRKVTASRRWGGVKCISLGCDVIFRSCLPPVWKGASSILAAYFEARFNMLIKWLQARSYIMLRESLARRLLTCMALTTDGPLLCFFCHIKSSLAKSLLQLPTELYIAPEVF